MICKDSFEMLREKYGNGISSWTIWADAEEGKPKSGIADVSFFLEENILEQLNSHYIFVGLNAAENAGMEDAEAWQSFHSRNPKQSQDYKLRYALKGTRFWGSYITDAIKDYPKTDSGEVWQMLRNNPDVVEKNIRSLEDEIQYLDKGNTVVIAIGNKAYRILSKNLGKKYRICKIMHYSSYVGRETYRNIVLKQLQAVD